MQLRLVHVVLASLVLAMFVAGFAFWPVWLIGVPVLLLLVIALVSTAHGGRWRPLLRTRANGR